MRTPADRPTFSAFLDGYEGSYDGDLEVVADGDEFDLTLITHNPNYGGGSGLGRWTVQDLACGAPLEGRYPEVKRDLLAWAQGVAAASGRPQPSALARLQTSLDSPKPHFASDVDRHALVELSGADRDAGIALLEARLARGDDPRIPRALAALGLPGSLRALQDAANSARDPVRAEVGAALVRLGDPELGWATLAAVLATTEVAACTRAVDALAALESPRALELLVAAAQHPDRGVVEHAFEAILRRLGLRGRGAWTTRAQSLRHRLTCGLPAIRAAAVAPLRELLADAQAGRGDAWTVDADRVVLAPLYAWIAKGEGGPELPSLAGLGLAEIECARTWACQQVEGARARGVTALLALDTPGAVEALRALRAKGGPLDAAIDAALAGRSATRGA